ncbi:amidohydrolase family protein [Neomicrococcus aestuarii]|uniref:Cytosine deaminase n=1 Tax=Neomicrococcus aestuarii TaxID=556325 RepID=A0A1L2ZN25_9MICC|nr:amidohydrolase family protein [Neomicrococcus aestuarii]APF40803.1 cytosine deaminase [Neomicrococcus aestuarii]
MRILNARLRETDGLHDVEVSNGRFTSITPAASIPGDAATAPASNDLDGSLRISVDVFDARGRMLVPQFVDAHLHLDYANTVGKPRLNESGTLFEAIDIWADHKAMGFVNKDLIKQNATNAIRAEVSNGVGFIRTHVDVTDPNLTALEAILEVKDEVREWCEVQIISFPQNGIFAYPNGNSLMEESLRRGADVVGGIPHFERSLTSGLRSVDWIFELAEKYDKLIDVHCDEIDDESSRFLEYMADLAVERSMQGRVTASHVVAMAYYKSGYMAKLLSKLREADVRFAINPTENLHLQGWGTDAPIPRGMAPIRTLIEGGLNVALGQDSIADPWYPIGEGDMLRILDFGLHVGHMLNEQYLGNCLDLITVNGAKNMGISDRYGIAVGNPASAIILDAPTDKEALWHQSDVLLSLHNGSVVFEREPQRTTWGSAVQS